MAWNALRHSAVQFNGSLSFLLRALYRGLALSSKFGIQNQQNPVIRKIPCNCLLMVGTATLANASFQSRNEFLCPFDHSNPRYFIVFWFEASLVLLAITMLPHLHSTWFNNKFWGPTFSFSLCHHHTFGVSSGQEFLQQENKNKWLNPEGV